MLIHPKIVKCYDLVLRKVNSSLYIDQLYCRILSDCATEYLVYHFECGPEGERKLPRFETKLKPEVGRDNPKMRKGLLFA